MRNQQTPNNGNLQGLRSDKRFDALVKQEMAEHQHLISSHNKEMQTLRDALNLCMEKCVSLSERNDQELKELKKDSSYHIGLMHERSKANEATIAEQKKTIDALHRQILDFQESYVTKKDLENGLCECKDKINSYNSNNLYEFQKFQTDYKTLFYLNKDDIDRNYLDCQEKLEKLKEKLTSVSSIFCIDKEGILREVRIYKGDMFVIEKKIENIYTLIERINKRVSISP
jgi:hypothetical protein